VIRAPAGDAILNLAGDQQRGVRTAIREEMFVGGGG